MNNHDVVTYALHGLSDKYDQVMGIIPHRDSFPDLKTVRSMTTEKMRLNSKSQPLLSDTSPSSPTILLTENANCQTSSSLTRSDAQLQTSLPTPSSSSSLFHHYSSHELKDLEDKSLKNRRDKFEWTSSSTYPPEVKLSLIGYEDKEGPYQPKTAECEIKPKSQWTNDDGRMVNQDQRLKGIIISCVPDDIMEPVISCKTAKATWTDLVHSFEGLVVEMFDWDEEEVSDDENMTQVNVLMALAVDDLTVRKNHARNSEWIDITMRKVNILLPMDEDADW
ncbi:hypothetical protein Tco_1538675 [Tanacetum coccineum]